MREQFCYDYDEKMKTRERSFEMPYLDFPSHWLVSIIPPFGGAVIRFRVRKKGYEGTDCVSIYLDMDNHIGFMEKPYWEVYEVDGDCFRCYMSETDKLIEAIEQALSEIKK
jgi:hypothetical protein